MDWLLFFVFFLAACGAGATGGMFSPGPWYRALDKPAWTPPDWVFPVVWTYVYLAISWAAARVAGLPGAELALALWAAQMAWNGLWTPVFFGLRNPRGGMIVLAVLWLAVGACAVVFAGLDRWTLLAFGPYLLWVTIAGALNLSVIRRNPAAGAAA